MLIPFVIALFFFLGNIAMVTVMKFKAKKQIARGEEVRRVEGFQLAVFCLFCLVSWIGVKGKWVGVFPVSLYSCPYLRFISYSLKLFLHTLYLMGLGFVCFVVINPRVELIWVFFFFFFCIPHPIGHLSHKLQEAICSHLHQHVHLPHDPHLPAVHDFGSLVLQMHQAGRCFVFVIFLFYILLEKEKWYARNLVKHINT